jgi:hypothetical protein
LLLISLALLILALPSPALCIRSRLTHGPFCYEELRNCCFRSAKILPKCTQESIIDLGILNLSQETTNSLKMWHP